MSRRVLVLSVVWTAVASANGLAQEPADAEAVESKRPDGPEAPVAEAERDRRAVWNSPEMLESRAWLEDYFRVSRRYDADEARDYLARLEGLDADGMRLWIARLEQARRRMLQRRLAQETGRRFQQAQAAVAQQQRQRNLERIAQQEAARARLAQQQLNAERLQSQALFRQRTASRDETLRRQFTDSRAFALLNFLDQQQLANDVRALRASREGR